MSDLFEHNIKKALEEYTVPLDKGAWEDFSKKQEAQKSKKINSIIKGLGLGVLLLGLGVGGYYFYPKNNVYKPVFTVQPISTIELETEALKRIERLGNDSYTIDTVELAKVDSKLEIREKVGKTNSTELKPFKNNQVALIIPEPIEQTTLLKAPEPLPQKKSNTLDSKINNGETTALNTSNVPTSAAFTASEKRCVGEVINFQANDASCTACEYLWDFSDGNTLTGTRVKYAFSNSGNYVVSLRIKNKAQVLQTSSNFAIDPVPTQNIEVDFTEENQIPVYQFKYLGDKIAQIQWLFPDGEAYESTSFSKTFYQKGSQEIFISISNMYGCTANLKQILEVQRSLELLAPTAFSPNNDGNNDTWMPELLKENSRFSNFTLQIFDRSQRLVYSSTSSAEPWDGKIIGSTLRAKIGEAYVWHAQVKDAQTGKIIPFKGSVIVVD